MVAAAVAGLFWWGGIGTEPVDRGSPAPAFSLPRLEGEPLVLAELRGRVVLVNFWATWCKPCEEEMPSMQRLYETHGPAGFELLAVSVDAAKDRDEVAAFRERYGLTFPILLDPDQVVSRRYQSFRFPETLLIDREGIVVERYVGPREWDHPAYVERIGRLLEAGSIR